MADHPSQTYRHAVARLDTVADNGSSIRGTGTLVSDRYVLTALHVVADRNHATPTFYSAPISLNFPGFTTTAKVVESAWNARLDWVLLECLDIPPIVPVPLGELSPGESKVAWETFGFPDSKPDGMTVAGTVRDVAATYQGVPALQLYSVEAAAGQGAPVSGLSGAPCIVDGAIVGIIRSSLMSHGLNVAGTMFACPITEITKSALVLKLPDPLRGLPGLPRRGLPHMPFRYLHHYTHADAEVFFGRGAAIRSLYAKVVTPGAASIIVVLGQSGVGKSSLLDAGLIPRLASTHSTFYGRREQAGGLTRSYREAAERLSLTTAQVSKPTLIVLDQVEEAWTHPHLSTEEEVPEFLDYLKAWQCRGQPNNEDRIILSIRKDWAPDLEARLMERGLFFTTYFVERLTSVDIEEVVHGLARTDRLRMQYNIQIEEGLGTHISSDLLSDQGSAIAPMLQIWMTRLWQDVSSLSPRVFSRAQYAEVRQQFPHLRDFLKSQIESMNLEFLICVSNGLVDDLLEWHTTTPDTSESRSRSELLTRYGHYPESTVIALTGTLIELYLLTGVADRKSPEFDKTRLAHDTLAPLVKERYRTSQRPGQRATRILEAKISDQPSHTHLAVLDEVDLSLVEAGGFGMRMLTESEKELLSRSQDAAVLRSRRQRWNRRALISLGAATFVGFIIAAVLAFVARAQRNQADSRRLAAQSDVRQQSDIDRNIAALVAILSLHKAPTAEGFEALWQIVRTSPRNRLTVNLKEEVREIVPLPRSRWMAVLLNAGASEKALHLHDDISPDSLRRLAIVSSVDGSKVSELDTLLPIDHVRVADSGTDILVEARGIVEVVHISEEGLLSTAYTERLPALADAKVGLSPNGATLAIAQQDELRLISIGSAEASVSKLSRRCTISSSRSSQQSVSAVATRDEGSEVILGLQDGSVLRMDPNTCAARVVASLASSVEALEFDPRAKDLIAIASGYTATVWNMETRQAVLTHTDKVSVTAMAFSPDGLSFAATYGDPIYGGVYVSQMSGLGLLDQHFEGSTQLLGFTENSSKLVLASRDGSARLYNLQTGEEEMRISREAGTGVGFIPMLSRIATSSKSFLFLSDAVPARVTAEIDTLGEIEETTHSLDGRFIAVGTRNGVLTLIDRKTDQQAQFRENSHLRALAFDRTGSKLAVSVGDAKKIMVLDLATQERDYLPIPDTGISLSFNPDGRLAIGFVEKDLLLCDLHNKHCTAPLPGLIDVTAVAFSPDGKLLAVSAENGVLFDTSTWKRSIDLDIAGSGDLSFSDDGSYLAAAWQSGQVRVFSKLGQLVSSFKHPYWSTSLDFSHRGVYLASGSKSGGVSMIAVKTGLSVISLQTSEPVQEVFFEPDGKHLISAAGQRNLIVARDPTSSEELVQTACSYLALRTLPDDEARYYLGSDKTKACQ